MTISLSYLAMADLFFRFSSVGMLFSIAAIYLVKARNLQTILGAGFAMSLAGFILLTAPIANHHYGVFRGIFLFLTETAPYMLWAWSMALLSDHFKPQQWPIWRYAVIGAVILWFGYFFGLNEGRGVMHDVNHAVEFIVLLHLLYFICNGFRDDLVDKRRAIRKLLIIGVSSYLIFFVVLELADAAVRDSAWFSFYHAMFVCIAVFAYSLYGFCQIFSPKGASKENTSVVKTAPEHLSEKSEASKIPTVFVKDHEKLIALMESGGFQTMGLTVRSLANELGMPEHQLRVLINQHMGFRNFSDFLNSYRIPAACQQLSDLDLLRKPILTIALEIGYGSVGPFNRAFKLHTGKTPKEYRHDFQN